MNDQTLRLFLTIVESKSLSEAARRHHMTQPAVSIAIANLEKELGQTLMLRSSGSHSRIQLTDSGMVYRAYAQKVLKLQEEMLVQLRQPACAGTLILGASTTPSAIIVPPLLAAFHKAFPNVTVRTSTYTNRSAFQALRSGEISLCITGAEIGEDEYIFEDFLYDPMVLIAPRSMNLGNSITLRQLQKLPMIARPPVSSTARIEAEFSKRGLSFSDMNVITRVYGNTDVLQAVSFGTGVGFITRSLLKANPKAMETVCIVGVKQLQVDRYLRIVKMRDAPFDKENKLFWNFTVSGQWKDAI